MFPRTLLILASFAPSLQIEPAKPAPSIPSGASTLLLSDGTAGTSVHMEVWGEVFKDGGFTQIVSEDPADSQLATLLEGDWQRVYLFAEFRGEVTAWTHPLREFARAHPASDVRLYLWKAPEGSVGDDRSILGTIALVEWHDGRTTIGYSLIANEDPNAGNAKSVPGFKVPDFKGIALIQPTSLAGPVDATESSISRGLKNPRSARVRSPLNDCKWECAQRYRTLLNESRETHKRRTELACALYGPHPDRPGNSDKLLSILAAALQDLCDSHEAALRENRECMALCEKRHKQPDREAVETPKSD